MARADDDGRPDGDDAVLGPPPPTAPPAAVRAAIKAGVLARSLGAIAAPPKLGGRYRLVREIGRGGMGTVWEAELEPIGRRVAIKLLRSGLARPGEGASRMLREALAVSEIGHEHIVRVHDVGTDDHGAPYVVMELLVGRSLARMLASRGALPWSDVAAIAGQVCEALTAAHALGVIHRDIKPANVFVLDHDDGTWRCKLLDFGLCKTAQGSDGTLTEAGALLGTPGYMAPEQIRGDVVDGRADLYALGCVMFELLTGRSPFGSTRAEDVLADQLLGRRASLEELAPDLPSAAVRLVEQALATEPGARPRDAQTLAAAIAAVQVARDLPASSGAPVRGIAAPSRGASEHVAARSGIARGFLLGVTATVAFAIGVAIVRHVHEPVAERASATSPALRDAPAAPLVIGDVEPTPNPAPSPLRAAPASDDGAREPAPKAADPPPRAAEPPPRPKNRRKPRSAAPPPEPAAARDQSTPRTRTPEIRDPFAAQ